MSQECGVCGEPHFEWEECLEEGEESFEKRWDKIEGEEYCKFENIPEADRLHPESTLCGYLKIASLMKNPSMFEVSAEHDIIYLCCVSECRELTDDDIIYLSRCGIHYNSEHNCFADFT